MNWPGWRTSPWHADAQQPDIRTWWGGLVDGMRDASGQMYMRNRYYDPATGQFTQPDPIGLAGGLNRHGFAEGDPVSYSDPYGLCPNPENPLCYMSPGEMLRNSLGLSNVPMHDNSSTPSLLYVSASADLGIHTLTVRHDQYHNQPQVESAATFPSASLNVAGGIERARPRNPNLLQYTIAINVVTKGTSVNVTVVEGPEGPTVGSVEGKIGFGTPAPPISISVKGKEIKPLHNQFHCGKVGC